MIGEAASGEVVEGVPGEENAALRAGLHGGGRVDGDAHICPEIQLDPEIVTSRVAAVVRGEVAFRLLANLSALSVRFF